MKNLIENFKFRFKDNYSVMIAFDFAFEKHKNQKRKVLNDDYIVHLIEVAILLDDYGYENLIVAGLLHDTIEDTDTSFEELETLFDEKIVRLVKNNTEDKSKSWDERKIDKLSKMRKADFDTQVLFAADKISGVRAMTKSYETLGNEIWKSFNAGKEKQRWFYLSICNLFATKEEQIFKDLCVEIEEFFNKI